MTKCDFCIYYNPGFKGEEPCCMGSLYPEKCQEAVERFSEAMKNTMPNIPYYYDRYGNPMVTPFKKAPEITC